MILLQFALKEIVEEVTKVLEKSLIRQNYSLLVVFL